MFVKADIVGKESRTRFFISKAKLVFAKLRQAFSSVVILHDFDIEYYIWIETSVLSYAIYRVFSQLSSDNSD